MFFLFRRHTRHVKPARRTPCFSRPRVRALEDRCLLSVGALDTGFGGTGVVTSSLSKSNDYTWTSVVAANGDIITAGTTVSGAHKTPAFALVAHTASGGLDTAFGSSGVAITADSNISPNLQTAAAAYLSTDTTGNANKIVEVATGSGISLARYNANGTLDTTFGSKGLVNTSINGGASCVAIQPADGKIIVGGWYNESSVVNSATAFLLLRYNPNGTLDTSFGSNGEVIYYPVQGDAVASLVVQADGKIVAGGYGGYNTNSATTSSPSEFTVLRYDGDGSLDSTFGSGGVVHTFWPNGGEGEITSLALPGNGQIVAVGAACPSPGMYGWGLARYNSDGSQDTTFGTGGLVTLTQPVFQGRKALSVALQSNGEIAVVGQATGANFAVATLTTTGSLDPAFGGTGYVLSTAYAATTSMTARSVLVQPSDGKLIVTGTVPDNSKQGASDFAVARYIGTTTGPQIGSFTASPNPVTSGSSETLTASNIIDADPGSTVTQVAIYVDSNGDGSLEPGTDQLLGYATQTSPGVWTFTFTVTLAPGSYTLFAQAEDSAGVFSNAIARALTVQ